MTTLIIISIYILSLFLSYNFFRIAYSKNGRWFCSEPTPYDLFMVFTPILNTLFCIVGYVGYYPKKTMCKINLIKFFKISK